MIQLIQFGHIYKKKKSKNCVDANKRKYDCNTNKCRVVIENAFGLLKNQWWIWRHFNSKVDRTKRVTITCCILHNSCEMCNEPKPRLANLENTKEVEFTSHMLLTL